MTDIRIHGVTKIEIVNAFRDNDNSRTVRITSCDHRGEHVTDITLYGETDALDALPKASVFREFTRSELEPA